MADRRLDDWLTAYLEYTDISESPVSYHTWAGISCIASALQRKVYMKWGLTDIFTNNYIVLVGPSGRARKAEPLEIAQWFVRELNLSTVGEDNTAESIIRDIRGAEISILDKTTGKWKVQSAVTCFVEELAVFTGYQNQTLLAYLTAWYDSRYLWTRRTKHQGTDKIVGMCFNLLASTAPSWLPHILTPESIGGGFTSRCIFIVEERKGKTVINPNLNMPDEELKHNLVHDLEIIQTLSGEYKFDAAGQKLMDEWYGDTEARTESGQNLVGDGTLAGYVSRRPTHLKKIAMSMAASRTDELVVTKGDLRRALSLLMEAEIKMPQVFSGVGRARYAAETDEILTYIKQKGTVKRSEILRAFHRDVDDASLETVMRVLIGMKSVRTVKRIPQENDSVYEYIGESAEIIEFPEKGET